MWSSYSILLIIILIWNVYVFLRYGWDKRQARKQEWRLSERRLLLETWLLGGIGAWMGARYFHHKTQKGYFRFSYYLSSAITLFVILYMAYSLLFN